MLTRQREFFQWIFGGASTAAVIVGVVWLGDHHEAIIADLTGQRSGSTTSSSIANETSPKAEVLKTSNLPGAEKKSSGALDVTVSSATRRQSDGSLVLDAKVIAAIALDGLKYDWVLPDGVSLSSGNLHGDLGSLADGGSSSLQITVSTPATENSHVILHVYRPVNGEKVGQVAHYNTLDQDAINAKLAAKRFDLSGAFARDPASVDFGRRAE